MNEQLLIKHQSNEQSVIIANSLWKITKEEYGDDYNAHLLEQYKNYLGLADKISERRSGANTFFLAVNTGLISAFGISNFLTSKDVSRVLILTVGIAVIILCYSWYRIIRSYKDLNTAKFKVIHEIEKRLPVSPYDSEWEAVGRGKNKNLYLPFTDIEKYVPWVFIALYMILIFYGIYIRTSSVLVK